ncbi:sulfoxide reductase heme-binding subunit YedZ [Gammaproteobacteria bacterium AH-315-E17]|nr:sulfoxide reductase heme-binding subunit YedZ [Gammaproteobacteria bacterium AH-315-E17]
MKYAVVIKPIVFLLFLAPSLYYFYAVYLALNGENILGPDPAQTLSLATGEWSIRILVVALAITPLRYLLKMPRLWNYRRMIGLFALFYVSLHLIVFLMFLLQWQWADIGREIIKRPYITIGFTAFILLLPLGLTSFQAAQRKMGRNWKKLHRLVYVVNVLAVIHILWVVRSSYFDALLYGSMVFVCLFYRVLRHYSLAVRQFSLRK